MGDMFKLCGNYEKALDCGMRAEEFAPPRNEHIVLLAECYKDLNDLDWTIYREQHIGGSGKFQEIPSAGVSKKFFKVVIDE